MALALIMPLASFGRVRPLGPQPIPNVSPAPIATPSPRRFETPSPRRYKPSTDRPDRLDLGARHTDLLAVARTHWAWWECLRRGWDRDDLEQELLTRAVARQGMGSRYDPVRAGMGKYLFNLTKSLLLNMLAKRRTRKARGEQLGDRIDVAVAVRRAAERPLPEHLSPDPSPIGMAGGFTDDDGSCEEVWDPPDLAHVRPRARNLEKTATPGVVRRRKAASEAG